MIFFSKVNKFRVKKDEDGITSCTKKTPLISKEFFSLKSDDNHISMTYSGKSHEDGLRTLVLLNSKQKIQQLCYNLLHSEKARGCAT